jgi:hypothetical protein
MGGVPIPPRKIWTHAEPTGKLGPGLLPNGILKLDLRAGDAGRARITLKGKGEPLPLPQLPITALPVTVELRAGTGTCWSATYGAGVQHDDAALFKARSD